MSGSRLFVVAALVAAVGSATVWDYMHRPGERSRADQPSPDRLLVLAEGGGQAPRGSPRRAGPQSTPRRAAPAPARSPGGAARTRTYKVKAGDSLSSIARRTLGDATRWREIADANGLASPDLIRPGQEIMIP